MIGKKAGVYVVVRIDEKLEVTLRNNDVLVGVVDARIPFPPGLPVMPFFEVDLPWRNATRTRRLVVARVVVSSATALSVVLGPRSSLRNDRKIPPPISASIAIGNELLKDLLQSAGEAVDHLLGFLPHITLWKEHPVNVDPVAPDVHGECTGGECDRIGYN